MEKYFQRQTKVADWNDEEIAQQVVLLLGVGGIGCTCAMAVCRLGVKKLILVDRDVVEESNLNRQILFGLKDVGRPKVEAAKDNLALHCIRTEVEAHHIDAVERWDLVVQLAREATAVFNAIDFGAHFDLAVTSLCVARSLPYTAASSYSHSAIIERFVPGADEPCWVCNNDSFDAAIVDALTPDKIQGLAQLAVPPHPPTDLTAAQVGSSVLPASIASHMMVTAWINGLCRYPLPHWASASLAEFSFMGFRVDRNPKCRICGPLRTAAAAAAAAAGPGDATPGPGDAGAEGAGPSV